MTTSKDTNISQAIKSRCLCLQIKPFKKPKDYADLIANNLKYSDIAENNIIDISKSERRLRSIKLYFEKLYFIVS